MNGDNQNNTFFNPGCLNNGIYLDHQQPSVAATNDYYDSLSAMQHNNTLINNNGFLLNHPSARSEVREHQCDDGNGKLSPGDSNGIMSANTDGSPPLLQSRIQQMSIEQQLASASTLLHDVKPASSGCLLNSSTDSGSGSESVMFQAMCSGGDEENPNGGGRFRKCKCNIHFLLNFVFQKSLNY